MLPRSIAQPGQAGGLGLTVAIGRLRRNLSDYLEVGSSILEYIYQVQTEHYQYISIPYACPSEGLRAGQYYGFLDAYPRVLMTKYRL